MDFIFDCLAIGDFADGRNEPPVDAILNLSEFDYPSSRLYQRIYFPDFEYLKDLSLIDQCTAYIRNQIKLRQRVLVHCFAGISRSTVICMAYLYECGMSFDEALALIRVKHPVANPHDALLRSLHDWYEINTGN
jgi:protein-tyrosine phosphatase